MKWFSQWALIGVGGDLLFFYFSLAPVPAHNLPLFPNADKVVHCLAYLLLTFWFCQLLLRRQHGYVVLFFVCQGILIEILQGFTGYRSFEVADMLANSIGAVIGYLICHGKAANFLVDLEHRLSHHPDTQIS